jgi:hypothetical protein
MVCTPQREEHAARRDLGEVPADVLIYMVCFFDHTPW